MESIFKINQRDIILLLFPFSDASTKKLRPCIVVSNNKHNLNEDIIVVPLTTNKAITNYSFILTNKDLSKGKLIKESKVKIERIFSVKKTFTKIKIGSIKKEIHKKIVSKIIELIN